MRKIRRIKFISADGLSLTERHLIDYPVPVQYRVAQRAVRIGAVISPDVPTQPMFVRRSYEYTERQGDTAIYKEII